VRTDGSRKRNGQRVTKRQKSGEVKVNSNKTEMKIRWSRKAAKSVVKEKKRRHCKENVTKPLLWFTTQVTGCPLYREMRVEGK